MSLAEKRAGMFGASATRCGGPQARRAPSRDPERGIPLVDRSNMDSVKADEHEWIYAEPLGWKDPVTVARDIDVQLTIVPHASGKEAYRQTLAKREAAATTVLSAWQVPGGPAIDSDGDGLPDLVELERGTNPNAADTDLDGLPDGADPDPLRGSPPPRVLRLPEFKAQPTARPQSIAEVKPVLGVPTLVIDGKPYGPMTYTRCAGSFPQLAEIAEHRFPAITASWRSTPRARASAPSTCGVRPT